MQVDTATTPEFLSRIEVARWLRIHPGSLANMAFKRRGPKFIRTGQLQGKALYRVSDVLAWLESNVEGRRHAEAVSQAEPARKTPAKRGPRRRAECAATATRQAKQRATAKRLTAAKAKTFGETT